MRISLRGDSATTREVRDMAIDLHRAGRTGELRVGAEGPELWSFTTPPLDPTELGFILELHPREHP